MTDPSRRPRCALVWFRRDLRLHDNTALRYALAKCDAVIPVFIDTTADESPWAPGAASRWWLHQSIMKLETSLTKRGSRLILRHGPAASAMLELARETGCAMVVWNRCYEPHWQVIDRRITRALQAIGIETASFPGALLHEPWVIASKSGGPYQVFAAFHRTAVARPDPLPPAAAPRRLPGPARWPSSRWLADFSLQPKIARDAGLARVWKPGESSARKRLAQFCRDGLDRYATGRDRPAVDGVSRLSPHLHFGEITPAMVWHAVRNAGHGRSAAAFLRELLWREFAFHILHHFPHTPNAPLRADFRHWRWRYDRKRERAWRHGETGIPLVDAGMRELWETGWMHNRVRMIVASLLTKNLNIDWRAGARWFWDTLVDADLANNTFGWQWTAGCGADAAPYFRIFNPVRQGARFDPDGAYVRHWVPQLRQLPDRYIHSPWLAPPAVRREASVELGKNYPRPIVDLDTSRQRALAAFRRLRARH